MTVYDWNVPPLQYDPTATSPNTPLPNYLQQELPANMRWVKNNSMSDEFNAYPVSNWYYNNKWVRYNPFWEGRSPSFFSEQNVYVRDNCLWLQSTERPPSDEDRRKMGNRLNGHGWKYATSFIRTAEKGKYGYYEIACKFMDCNVSCAFWFINDRDTEIDVFEYSTSPKPYDCHARCPVTFKNNFNMNTILYSGQNRDVEDSSPFKINVGRDLSQEIVKVGLLWKRDVLVWYLNDREVRRIRNDHFHIPLFLQLDSEVFQEWFGVPGAPARQGGPPEPKKLPNAWKVFYVRSYKMASR